jgi:hypothetical protein
LPIEAPLNHQSNEQPRVGFNARMVPSCRSNKVKAHRQDVKEHTAKKLLRQLYSPSSEASCTSSFSALRSAWVVVIMADRSGQRPGNHRLTQLLGSRVVDDRSNLSETPSVV